MITQLLTPSHVAFVLVALLLVFGPKRLPQTGRALGQSLREFREGIAGRDGDAADPHAESPPAVLARRDREPG